MTQMYFHLDEKEPVSCDNCDWEGVAEDLEITSDLEERISPGDIVPAGECPECNCLAYLAKPKSYTPQYRCDAITSKDIDVAKHANKMLDMLRLFVDPVMKLPGGSTTTVDTPRLRDDVAALIKEIDDAKKPD
jgi:hypothetical protein